MMNGFFIFTFCSLAVFSMSEGHTKERTLFVEGSQSGTQRWPEVGGDEENSVRILLDTLKKSPAGARLLQDAQSKAAESGETLFDILAPGKGSLTDTTLIRRFPPHAPHKIVYETRSKVYINKDLNQVDAVLDLAHEFTHYSFRRPFNPYAQNFSLDEFIRSTVEGVGGEVEAFLMECKVLYELYPGQNSRKFNCEQILDKETGLFSKDLAIKQFYKVGQYYKEFIEKLKGKKVAETDLPSLSDKDPVFISSAYSLPYPVAAYQEFTSVVERVCDNDKRRLQIMKQAMSGTKKNGSRRPASMEDEVLARHPDFKDEFESYKKRCVLKD